MKKLMWFSMLVLVFSRLDAQENPDVFNVIFKQTFENSTTGAYDRNEWNRDWNNPGWADNLARTYIESTTEQGAANKVMKWVFPKSTYGPYDAGGTFNAPVSGQTEAYFSYNIKFKPGFDFVKGGKLPGMAGGKYPVTSQPKWDEGFNNRLMWTTGGGVMFYTYHQDQPSQYGHGIGWGGFRFDTQADRWYNITIRMVLNSVGSDGGNKDGIMEGYIDGVLQVSIKGMRFRNLSTILIDKMMMHCFFGGAGTEWSTTRDEWAIIDDVYMFTYKQGVNVPRGFQASPAGRVLQLPNMQKVNGTAPVPPPVVVEPPVEEPAPVTPPVLEVEKHASVVNLNKPEVASLSDRSVLLNSQIFMMGDEEVISYGVCWSKDQNPVVGVNSVSSQEKSACLVPAKRVKQGLLALHAFNEGAGNKVKDLSGNSDPLDLTIEETSKVEWIQGQGLKVKGNTIIKAASASSRIVNAAKSTNEITFEAWVMPAKMEQAGPARIMTLSTCNDYRGITLGQNGAGTDYNYVCRINSTSSSANGLPEVAMNERINDLGLHHLVFTRDKNGVESIYINGVLVKSLTRAGNFSTWDKNYQFALANELSMARSWEGTYLLTAVYDRALAIAEVQQNFNAGYGSRSFSNQVENLEPSTLYYTRAYAETKSGIHYSESSSFTTAQEGLVSVDQANKRGQGIKVYPNPSKGMFNVAMQGEKEGRIEIMIYDTRGVLVFQQAEVFSPGQELPVDLSSYSRGVYIVRVVDSSGLVHTSRAILE